MRALPRHRPATAFRAHVDRHGCVACHDAPAHKTNQTARAGVRDLPSRSSRRRPAGRGRRSGLRAVPSRSDDDGGQLTVAETVGGASRRPSRVRRSNATERVDRARAAFNHEVHMKPTCASPRGPTKLECVDAAMQAGMRPVVAPARRRHRGGPAARLDGARHLCRNCASCHPLYFDPLIDAVAPHDTPEKVHAFVDAVAGAVHRGRIPARSENPIRCGADSGQLSSTPMRTVTHGGRVDGEVRTARANGCSGRRPARSATRSSPRGAAAARRARRTCRTAWMPHARFDHRAHQLPPARRVMRRTTSRETSDVLMPSIATCQPATQPAPGAEARCFECHGYHDWTKPPDRRSPVQFESARPVESRPLR